MSVDENQLVNQSQEPNTATSDSVAVEATDLVAGLSNADTDGCDYQGYEFGAGTYPDSVCLGGQLYDADDCDEQGRLYERDEEIPCPVCRPADAIDYWTEQNRHGGASKAAARSAAKSLVADILSKRGLLAHGQDTNTSVSDGTTQQSQ